MYLLWGGANSLFANFSTLCLILIGFFLLNSYLQGPKDICMTSVSQDSHLWGGGGEIWDSRNPPPYSPEYIILVKLECELPYLDSSVKLNKNCFQSSINESVNLIWYFLWRELYISFQMLLHILTFITIYIRPKKHTTHLHYNLHIRPKKHTTHSRTLSHLVFFQRAYSSSDIRVRTDIILNEYMCQSNQIFFDQLIIFWEDFAQQA